ncbi:MAG: diaminopimelate decarboxylase [Rhodospirillales bacterium RIFCSPLOWO2_12_FULL_58_28]|nr:MAG: diaminopimelate decarboxylase [Rhodospirillales bacterium RIFCSPLOWO2_02_FULL_58_16]OHC77638.1 MAG: diaminopimelate decarboxylase [Rhodospirillales bacterium RIFCSPLOWO2_12_FULL_58_28]
MDHFTYRDGRLCAEDVSLEVIADKVGTPFYCYSTATLERHYRAFADAFAGLDAMICYAVKANSNIAVIRTLANIGAGADVVSGGELKRALAAGVSPAKIVFSGVGKSEAEIAAALKAGVARINVESDPELDVLNKAASSMGVIAAAAIRVNPDIDANTHDKITTGRRENKFGIEWTRAHEVFRRAAAMKSVAVTGIAVHIGSQITDIKPFADAFVRMRDLTAILRADGHSIDSLDIGGGLGVPYDIGNLINIAPTPGEYADAVKSILGNLGCRLILEPGRAIAGNAGVMVSRVLYIKEGASRTFVIIDAAMNDLLRPALYGAAHAVVPIIEARPNARRREMDVVGPVCETGDTFAKQLPLPEIKAGDLLAIRTAGAYSAAMSSTYNSRALIPEVLVKGGGFAVIRRRVTVDDQMAYESSPPWLEAGGTDR